MTKRSDAPFPGVLQRFTARGSTFGWAAALVLAAALPLSAQRGAERGPRPDGPPRGPQVMQLDRNVEAALREARTLGLDEEAVRELEALQRDLLPLRQEFEREVRALRERVAADGGSRGEARRGARGQMREEMRELMERRREAVAPFRERYESLLNPSQREQVREWASRRPGDGGRGGPGGAGRGQGPGRRGPGA